MKTTNKLYLETIEAHPDYAPFPFVVAGDSMAPAYPGGTRILCQRVDEVAFIEWGRVYLLDTINGVMLKQVCKSDIPGCVTCCSLNPDPAYTSFDVDTKYIRGWFRVLMKMTLV
ncbi:MAG: S24 family peptidase [Bacteroidales bacterium]|nr:S24 family peptidase [Bacteroidales bacterium]